MKSSGENWHPDSMNAILREVVGQDCSQKWEEIEKLALFGIHFKGGEETGVVDILIW